MRGPLLRAPARGFTLIELFITMGLLGLVLAGVFGALTVNQKQYRVHHEVADMQSRLRLAAQHLERSLQLAGYGIDPNYAVEPWAMDGTGAAVAGGARDASGPFGSDQLVVHYRHPLFSRTVATASATSMTLSSPPPANDPLLPGQRMLVLCPGRLKDPGASAYVTVASASGASMTLAGTSGPFPFNETLSHPCFSDGNAVAMRVERRHYFVAQLQEAAATGTSPARVRLALLVSRGVDLDGNGVAGQMPPGWPGPSTSLGDAELLALEVEQLQVAYGMNVPTANLAGRYGLTSGPDADGNFVFGDSGAVDAPTPTNPRWSGAASKAPTTLQGMSTPAPPLLDTSATACAAAENLDPDNHCGYGATRRYLGHPGNVRLVRFALVARSVSTDADLGRSQLKFTDPADGDGPLENLDRTQLPPASRHRRLRFHGSVSLRNMFQRTHFLPPMNGATPVGG